VFRLDKSGSNYSVIQDFGAPGHGGQTPRSVSWSSDGFLYGTSSAGPNDGGTLFKMHADGTGYQILRAFGSISDPAGSQPAGPLIEGQDAMLYGTTHFGGSGMYYGGGWSVGTLFKISTDGNTFAVLHSFATNAGDGFYPASALTQLK